MLLKEVQWVAKAIIALLVIALLIEVTEHLESDLFVLITNFCLFEN